PPEEAIVVLSELSVHAPGSLVAGNGIVLHPSAAGVLVKVLTGIGGLVHGIYIEAGCVGKSSQRLFINGDGGIGCAWFLCLRLLRGSSVLSNSDRDEKNYTCTRTDASLNHWVLQFLADWDLTGSAFFLTG